MEVVICHLTRMKAPSICIAGIEPKTGNHIRPVIRQGQLNTDLLDCLGGCINMAKVMETGPIKDVGQKPEVEDRLFEPQNLAGVKTLKPHEFWALLLTYSKDSLRDIFGDDLETRGYSCVVRRGAGNASLGLLLPGKTPTVEINEFEGKKKIRVKLIDKDQTSYLSLTDLRFYGPDLETPSEAVVKNIARRLRSGVNVILSVGLTRPFSPKPGEQEECHWLQVNNIHMLDDPLWEVDYGK
jgi:hypothetical protein